MTEHDWFDAQEASYELGLIEDAKKANMSLEELIEYHCEKMVESYYKAEEALETKEIIIRNIMADYPSANQGEVEQAVITYLMNANYGEQL